jgi:hypothetical protein
MAPKRAQAPAARRKLEIAAISAILGLAAEEHSSAGRSSCGHKQLQDLLPTKLVPALQSTTVTVVLQMQMRVKQAGQ